MGKQIGMEIDIGFACSQKKREAVSEDGPNTNKNKISGQTFKSADYEEVYLTSEYVLLLVDPQQTRLKAKDIIDKFMEQPIDPITDDTKLVDLCAFPTKKCAFVFTDSNKRDRTSVDYVA